MQDATLRQSVNVANLRESFQGHMLLMRAEAYVLRVVRKHRMVFCRHQYADAI
jgi:hypothetical protein